MAVNPRNGRDSGSRIKDEAQRHSAGVENDLYTGRMNDDDLSESDGKCLGERDEWNLGRVSRRGAWKGDW